MNAELVKEALRKVGNACVLVNLISQRVRQLSAGGGGLRKPLIANAENLGLADIALREIIEGKMGFEVPENTIPTRGPGHNRQRPLGWGKPHATTKKLAA